MLRVHHVPLPSSTPPSLTLLPLPAINDSQTLSLPSLLFWIRVCAKTAGTRSTAILPHPALRMLFVPRSSAHSPILCPCSGLNLLLRAPDLPRLPHHCRIASLGLRCRVAYNIKQVRPHSTPNRPPAVADACLVPVYPSLRTSRGPMVSLTRTLSVDRLYSAKLPVVADGSLLPTSF